MTFTHAVLDAAGRFAADPWFWIVGGLVIGIIAFSKGGFGGGGASLGIPLLSFIMDPIAAAIVVAPLISFMDMFALRAFGRSTWSIPDLLALLPGMALGMSAGYLLFTRVDHRIVALVIGAVTLAFAIHWFVSGRRRANTAAPTHRLLALVAGSVSGFTTFIAHAGGPPIAMYLMRRGLSKELFVGTTTVYFTIGNAVKLLPYGLLLAARPETVAAALLLAPVVPVGVMLGVRAHRRIDRDTLFLVTNLLLLAAGGKLMLDSLRSLGGF